MEKFFRKSNKSTVGASKFALFDLAVNKISHV